MLNQKQIYLKELKLRGGIYIYYNWFLFLPLSQTTDLEKKANFFQYVLYSLATNLPQNGNISEPGFPVYSSGSLAGHL